MSILIVSGCQQQEWTVASVSKRRFRRALGGPRNCWGSRRSGVGADNDGGVRVAAGGSILRLGILEEDFTKGLFTMALQGCYHPRPERAKGGDNW